MKRYAMCLFILGLLVLNGCALLRPAEKESTKYLIDQMPAALGFRHTHQAMLVVLTPETHAIYNTTKMAYSIVPHQIGYYYHNEWAATPSQMLHPLIAKTFESSHYFKAVVTPPVLTNNAYFLRTQLQQLVLDFTTQPALLRMSARVTLSDAQKNKVIATSEFSVSEPLQRPTPESGALATNCATAKMLQNIRAFVIKNLKPKNSKNS